MATDTEPPPAAPPPWHQDLQLRRRRDGRVVAPVRPPKSPPPPVPAPRSTDSKPHRPTSRYIDAFGEIVGLPSPRGDCEDPISPPSDAVVDELQYGPGIVSRLRSRYLSMAQRQTAGGDPDPLRRAASLQDLLRREGAFERGAVQDSYLLTGRGALTAPPAWGESIRKAKSVGDLVSSPREADESCRPAPSDSAGRGRVPVEGGRSERSGAERTPAGAGRASDRTVEVNGTGSKKVGAGGASEKTRQVRRVEKSSAVKSDIIGEKVVKSEGADERLVKPGAETTTAVRLSSFGKTVSSTGPCEKSAAVKSSGETPPSSGGTCGKPAKLYGEKTPMVRTREKAPKTATGPGCAVNRAASGGSNSTTAVDRSVAIEPVGVGERPSTAESTSTVRTMKAESGGPQVIPRSLQDSRLVRKNSLPAADTVSTVKRLFERPAGGGGPGRDAPPPEKGAPDGGGRPPVADALLAARGDDVAGAPARLMAASEAVNHATNGHLPAVRTTQNGQSATPPLRAKDMVSVLLNGTHGGRRGDQTIVAGPVMKGGPLTKASLAAAVRRSSPPAADPGRSDSIQAVNARLVSAAAETGSRKGGPATNGVSQPIAWHQQVNNSTRYNFTDRSDVPEYIEDDGMDIHRPAKPKPSDTGYVLLPGFEPGQTSDEDLVAVLAQPESPPECPVSFSNDGVIINGHSSLLRQPREGTRAVSFSEARPMIFRYPSEASLLDTESAENAPRQPASDPTAEDGDGSGDPSSTRLADAPPAAVPTATTPPMLSTYTSSRLASEEAAAFQLGVTRRPPPPSVPAPAPPTAPAPAPPPEQEVVWSAETTADMLF